MPCVFPYWYGAARSASLVSQGSPTRVAPRQQQQQQQQQQHAVRVYVWRQSLGRHGGLACVPVCAPPVPP